MQQWFIVKELKYTAETRSPVFRGSTCLNISTKRLKCCALIKHCFLTSHNSFTLCQTMTLALTCHSCNSTKDCCSPYNSIEPRSNFAHILLTHVGKERVWSICSEIFHAAIISLLFFLTLYFYIKIISENCKWKVMFCMFQIWKSGMSCGNLEFFYWLSNF